MTLLQFYQSSNISARGRSHVLKQIPVQYRGNASILFSMGLTGIGTTRSLIFRIGLPTELKEAATEIDGAQYICLEVWLANCQCKNEKARAFQFERRIGWLGSDSTLNFSQFCQQPNIVLANFLEKGTTSCYPIFFFCSPA
ncbi:hypothetical protein M404DRAFT_647723 [Pisolithus tinctorius Marx 270]|uniref:Uncharacterized protein n=1 Tax=Pisolithus tinctorius Marx 270 TaxID=870435 RepID=A0A0C3NAG1_PISTI|nr:hypothetical protein M404DRAFT_647723 [Pisolithus tinctorius Marx 270]